MSYKNGHINYLVLKHFNGVLIGNDHKNNNDHNNYFILDGFILPVYIKKEYTETSLKFWLNQVYLTKEEMNSTFHKSWEKIKNSSKYALILEQILHYITTYGLESIGIYNNTVYFPAEELNIPNIEENIPLQIIKGLTSDEVKSKIFSILNSGIALEEETLKDYQQVLNHVGYTPEQIESISNKEAKVRFFYNLNIIPSKPEEFLRFVVYILTGGSLLIKNKETLNFIDTQLLDSTKFDKVYELFKKYQLEKNRSLGEIFYRYKPIFLILKRKGDPHLNKIINKIRKDAKKYHKPFKEDYLNNITKYIKEHKTLPRSELEFSLLRTNIFRKIRLLYALSYYEQNPDYILYKIRNGKSYLKMFDKLSTYELLDIANIKDIIYAHVCDHIFKSIKDKSIYSIYIPYGIKYALPSSEKQFIGNFPSGTKIHVENNSFEIGVHWKNEKERRIDLDLALLPESDHHKIGWDGDYRTENGKILFSGDNTTAPLPNGASEVFYISEDVYDDSFLVSLNFWNFYDGGKIPFQLFLSEEQDKNISKSYMVDPNKIILSASSYIHKPQKTIGLIDKTSEGTDFFVLDQHIGDSISSGDGELLRGERKYMIDFYKNSNIYLNDILKHMEKDGMIDIVDDPKDADIDLSPKNIEKNTIINLMI